MRQRYLRWAEVAVFLTLDQESVLILLFLLDACVLTYLLLVYLLVKLDLTIQLVDIRRLRGMRI